MSTKKPVRSDDGFTLVELLIALLLLGLTLGLLFPALHQGQRLLAASEHWAAQSSTEATMSLLRDLIAGARIPQNVKTSDGSPSFIGLPHQMSFVTRLDQPGTYAGLYHVRLSLVSSEKTPGTLSLVLETRLYREPVEEQIHTLLDGIERGSFRYFGEVEQEATPTWQTTWVAHKPMPTLVSFELSKDSRRIDHAVHLPLTQQ